MIDKDLLSTRTVFLSQEPDRTPGHSAKHSSSSTRQSLSTEVPFCLVNVIRFQRHNTDWVSAVIQFLMHDISHTKSDPEERLDIAVPLCDQFFDPNCTGQATLPLWRAQRVAGTGTRPV